MSERDSICASEEKPAMPKAVKDRTGQRFGRLLVLEFAGLGRKHGATWKCRCDCGRVIVTEATYFTGGQKRSCGCLQAEVQRSNSMKHGGYYTSEYKIWVSIKARCTNPRYRDWKDYGGRGITICERWRDSFENFLADMGQRPSKRHSIEREKNSGHYEPGNCVWATRVDQARNRRSNRMIEFAGETLCLAAWAERTGLSSSLIKWRLRTPGWSVEEALATPAGGRRVTWMIS